MACQHVRARRPSCARLACSGDACLLAVALAAGGGLEACLRAAAQLNRQRLTSWALQQLCVEALCGVAALMADD